MRPGVELGEFFQVQAGRIEYQFEPGSVYKLREADIDQEIYGMPEWLAVVQSALLNESATLFRRRYYTNSSHAVFILYMTDPQPEGMDVDALRQALRDSRGPGNFRNLFVHSPNGKKDGLQPIPISEVAAKDEFTGIKRVTRDDIPAAARVPRNCWASCSRMRAGLAQSGMRLRRVRRWNWNPCNQRCPWLTNGWASRSSSLPRLTWRR